MRSAIISLVSAVAFAACSSGTTFVTVRQPVPAPQPPEPLEIILGRPVRDNIFVQTNRHAYVAIFEIIPERGVALVYPSSARQRRVVLSGLSRLPVWWAVQRTTHGNGRPSLEIQPTRYIYAIASDEPLRLSDETFQAGYLHRTLGSGAYRAVNVHATMRALSRHFVTAVVAEEWAEEVYVLAPKYASEPYRIARVYCPEGTVYEVPIEMADRVWCPLQPRDAVEEANRPPGRDVATLRRKPVRPDSVLGNNGLRVRTRARGRGLLSRIPDSVDAETGKKTHVADEAKDSKGDGRGNDKKTHGADEAKDSKSNGRGNGDKKTHVADEAKDFKGNGRGNGGVPPGHDPLTETRQEEKSKAKSEEKKSEEKSEQKKSDARLENNSDIKSAGPDKSRSDADKGPPNEKKHEPNAEKTASQAEAPEPQDDKAAPGTEKPKHHAEKSSPNVEKPDPKPEQISKQPDEPRREAGPEPRRKSESESLNEPRSEHPGKSGVEPAADDSVSRPKAESKPESKAEPKDAKTETKGDPRAETKEEPKSETKDEPQANTKEGPRGEKRADPPKSRGRTPSSE